MGGTGSEKLSSGESEEDEDGVELHRHGVDGAAVAEEE